MVSVEEIKSTLKDAGGVMKCAIGYRHVVARADLLKLATNYKNNPSATELYSRCERCHYPLVLSIDSSNDKRYVVSEDWRDGSAKTHADSSSELAWFF
jgi:hypothetical protein